MRILVFAVALAFFVQGATAEERRPALTGVSAIRVGNYGAPSVLLEGREKMRPILDELNTLRSKAAWRRGDTKPSCYSTVIVMSGKKTLATFRVKPGQVVEKTAEKVQASYSLAIAPADIPMLLAQLAEIAPVKDCPQ